MLHNLGQQYQEALIESVQFLISLPAIQIACSCAIGYITFVVLFRLIRKFKK